jgi:hypothetical protein
MKRYQATFVCFPQPLYATVTIDAADQTEADAKAMAIDRATLTGWYHNEDNVDPRDVRLHSVDETQPPSPMERMRQRLRDDAIKAAEPATDPEEAAVMIAQHKAEQEEPDL